MRKLSFYLLVFLLKGWTPLTASTNDLRDNGCQQITFDQDRTTRQRDQNILGKLMVVVTTESFTPLVRVNLYFVVHYRTCIITL